MFMTKNDGRWVIETVIVIHQMSKFVRKGRAPVRIGTATLGEEPKVELGCLVVEIGMRFGGGLSCSRIEYIRIDPYNPSVKKVV